MFKPGPVVCLFVSIFFFIFKKLVSDLSWFSCQILKPSPWVRWNMPMYKITHQKKCLIITAFWSKE